VRVRIDGQLRDLGEEIHLDKNKHHEIEVVVDRLLVKEGAEKRMNDSLEIASHLSEGIVKVEREGTTPMVFSQKFSCIDCGFSFPEITPRMFSFNSPQGAVLPAADWVQNAILIHTLLFPILPFR